MKQSGEAEVSRKPCPFFRIKEMRSSGRCGRVSDDPRTRGGTQHLVMLESLDGRGTPTLIQKRKESKISRKKAIWEAEKSTSWSTT